MLFTLENNTEAHDQEEASGMYCDCSIEVFCGFLYCRLSSSKMQSQKGLQMGWMWKMLQVVSPDMC